MNRSSIEKLHAHNPGGWWSTMQGSSQEGKPACSSKTVRRKGDDNDGTKMSQVVLLSCQDAFPVKRTGPRRIKRGKLWLVGGDRVQSVRVKAQRWPTRTVQQQSQTSPYISFLIHWHTVLLSSIHCEAVLIRVHFNFRAFITRDQYQSPRPNRMLPWARPNLRKMSAGFNWSITSDVNRHTRWYLLKLSWSDCSATLIHRG